MALITGTQGNDFLEGDRDDQLEGLGGNDTLVAYYSLPYIGNSSELSGGDGNDFLDTSLLFDGTDNGGEGNDTISYSSVSSGYDISVDLSLPTNQVRVLNRNDSIGDDRGTLISIENVIGGQGDDRLVGDDLNNRLDGSEGDDFLDGGDGDDFLAGGFGNNSIFGGLGTDTAVFSGSTDQYDITVDGDTTTVEWIAGGGVESTDVLSSIEKLQFSNGTFDNDFFINNPPPDNGNDTLLNTPFNRFRNRFVGGTYLFANQAESANIIQNFSGTFALEGEAFKVSSQPADGLIRFNRFANLRVAGTYLFATEGESVSIRANFSDVFREEGTAFYAYGAGSGLGTDYYRLANLQVQGTYLFVNETEKNSALANFPNLFSNEGVAFQVG